jgi:MoxR-like ATPase
MSAVATRDEPQVIGEARRGMDIGQGPLLAAALAAALVEYRRYVGQRDEQAYAESGGAHWRMVTRLEQLRS